MTVPGTSTPTRPRRAWLPLGASLAVVVLLATIGSFAVNFGVMTSCTNTFSCAATSCSPCATTDAWLTAGWVGQGVLLLVGVVLAVLAARRSRSAEVRLGAVVIGPLAIMLFVGTTWLAVRSS